MLLNTENHNTKLESSAGLQTVTTRLLLLFLYLTESSLRFQMIFHTIDHRRHSLLGWHDRSHSLCLKISMPWQCSAPPRDADRHRCIILSSAWNFRSMTNAQRDSHKRGNELMFYHCRGDKGFKFHDWDRSAFLWAVSLDKFRMYAVQQEKKEGLLNKNTHKLGSNHACEKLSCIGLKWVDTCRVSTWV